jgi:hypothetical protein
LFNYAPEVDPINFAPRVKTPLLMLNGRDDFTFPIETSQEPLFRLLGTPGSRQGARPLRRWARVSVLAHDQGLARLARSLSRSATVA